MKEFDVVVIGSGPGGYICAIRCAQLGMKVAIIEKYKTLGGTCLNVGCIPSKAWLDSSEKYHELTHRFADHGITTKGVELDFSKMSERVKKVVSDVCGGIQFLMKKNKIEVFQGLGTFVDAHTIEVKGEKGSESIKAKKVVIATGSKPSSLPGVTIDKERVITSTEALVLKELPKKLIVIGGGVIGLELTSVFKRLGSEVTVVEYADNIIATMDADMSKNLHKVLKKDGVEFFLGHGVTNVKADKKKVVVTAKDKNTNTEVNLEGDYCLVAVGRRPFTEGLNLDKAGVKLDERGRIETDHHLQTNVSHIYAIGDVVKGAMLAHKAEEEGVFVAEVMAGQKPHINYNLIPGVVYTWPEVSSVGATEDQLKKEGREYKVGSFPFKASGRARASNESDGLVKVLADKKTDEILGVHMIGPRVADMIGEAVVAMEFKASAEDIGIICHAHPTYSEAFKEACLVATANRGLNI
jgi:dihydrolipoamide dehydrogenase